MDKARVLLLGFIFLIQTGLINASSEKIPQESEIYERFLAYRHALNTPSSELSGYFSKNVLQKNVELLLEESSAEKLTEIVRRMTNRFRFGDWIHEIYSYSVQHIDGERVRLDLVCRTKGAKLPKISRISYVYDQGSWLIDHIETDVSQSQKMRTGKAIIVFPERKP